MKQHVDKPLYQVPSMQEIAALPHNGYTVVSSFSGAGGSCLGFRMANFHVLWANEFIPAAQETYRANHPTTHLDTRDIRTVQPEEILAITGLQKGELDVFEGSPPCASFSSAGKRETGWGKVKDYSDTRQRVDDLFFEYVRLLNGLQPKVFVAENVSGLIKGVAKGYFIDIHKKLRECGYTVSARLLDAQWLGVPQARQRIIFVGVRNDLVERYGVKPVHPKPLPYNYTVREALPWVLRQGDNGGFGTVGYHDTDTAPSGTIGSNPTTGNNRCSPASIVAMKAIRDDRGAFGNGGDITDTPSPTILSGSVGTHWIEEQRIPIRAIHDTGGQPRFSAGDITDTPSPTVTAQQQWYIEEQSKEEKTEKRKFTIAELKRICAFPDDFRLTGTYSQQWERLGRAVPPVMMSKVASTIQTEILDRLPKGG